MGISARHTVFLTLEDVMETFFIYCDDYVYEGQWVDLEACEAWACGKLKGRTYFIRHKLNHIKLDPEHY